MVSAGNTDSSVTLTFRARDQVSPVMNRVEGSLNRVGQSAAATGRFVAANATTLVSLGAAAVAAAGPLSQMLVQMGLINEEQQKTVQSGILLGGVLVSTGTFVVQLAQLIVVSGLISRLRAMNLSMASLGPTVLAVASAIVALTTALQILAGQETTLEKLGLLEIPGENRAGRLAGFGTRALPFGAGHIPGVSERAAGIAGGAQNVVVNAGTIVADEGGLRELSKRIGRIFQEEERIGGFQP